MINSSSTGDPNRFLTIKQLEERFLALPPSPRDRGAVTRILVRHAGGVRELLTSTELTVDDGVVGDSWGRDPKRDPQAQLAVMQQGVAELIANGQPLVLFGDKLPAMMRWFGKSVVEFKKEVGSVTDQLGGPVK